MKILDFLTEYRRDITAQSFGDRLIQRFAKETFPAGLEDVWRLVMMAYKPTMFGAHRYTARVGNELLTPDTKTAPDLLKQHKQQVINDILQFIENRDPTRNKEYTQWMVRQWVADNVELEDLNRHNLIAKFDVLKRKNLLRPDQRDINRFKTYNDFENTIEPYELPGEQQQELDKGKYQQVYQDDDVRVIIPNDERAACYYGQGTRWCTSGRENNMFNHYNNQGPLFILLPKHPQYTGEKYQLHFQSGQFMNEKDASVDPMELLAERFPNLYDWFMEEYPNYITSCVQFVPDQDIERIASEIKSKTSDYAESLIDEVEMDEDSADIIRNVVNQIDGATGSEFKELMSYAEFKKIEEFPDFIAGTFENELNEYSNNGDDQLDGLITRFIRSLKLIRDENGEWNVVNRFGG